MPPTAAPGTPPRQGLGAKLNQFVTPGTSPQGKGKEKAPVVRLAEARENSLWVGGSDGSIKVYQTGATGPESVMILSSLSGMWHLADLKSSERRLHYPRTCALPEPAPSRKGGNLASDRCRSRALWSV
jgi:hypothetical protein